MARFKDLKMEKDLKKHWNNAYQNASAIDRMSWYEENPAPSLQLIEKCELDKKAAILNVGAGATTLVDELLKLNYQKVIANDLSSEALEKLKERLGNQGNEVQWIVDDLTNPKELQKLENIDLWHDRAVLHFFNEPKQQDSYFGLIHKLIKKNGFVIIATFNLCGAEKCSGLPVHRYNKEMLQSKLGEDFKLLEAFDYTFKMPSGDTRAYVYTLFKRIS